MWRGLCLIGRGSPVFRVTVIKSGQTYVYEVGLKQMKREMQAWTTDPDCTALIIHKIQGDQT